MSGFYHQPHRLVPHFEGFRDHRDAQMMRFALAFPVMSVVLQCCVVPVVPSSFILGTPPSAGPKGPRRFLKAYTPLECEISRRAPPRGAEICYRTPLL